MLQQWARWLCRRIQRHNTRSNFKEDLYGELGLKKSATPSEIKRAFVQLTKQFHPDTNRAPTAKVRYRKINEAYQVLKNATKKSEYDHFLKNAEAYEEEPEVYDFSENSEFEGFFYDDFGEGGGGGGASGGGNDFNSVFRDFSDFFKFPESTYKQERAVKGKNITLNVNISFPEAVNGVMKQISFLKRDICPECEGSRSKSGSVPIKCRKCQATGIQMVMKENTQLHLQCRPCDGKGFIIQEICDYCTGKGVSNEENFEDVWISRGVRDKEVIMLKGRGNKGDCGGVRGDLILQIRLVEDQRFRIEGNDIYVEREVTIAEAMLGLETSVETLDGPRKLIISPRTHDRTMIRFPGLGLVKVALSEMEEMEEKGDLFVVVRILFSKEMTDQQRSILAQIRDLETQLA